MILYRFYQKFMNYNTSWAGEDNPTGWGQFQAQNEAFTFLVICCKYQKNCLIEIWFYIDFYHDFIHAGAGADNSNGVNFEHHRKLLSLWSFAAERWFYIASG